MKTSPILLKPRRNLLFFNYTARSCEHTRSSDGVLVPRIFYIIFFGLIVPYNTLCYHKMTRPVSRICERPPFRGSDLIQTDSPGTPPTYRLIIKLSLSLYICLQNLGVSHLAHSGRRRGGTHPPSEFFRS